MTRPIAVLRPEPGGSATARRIAAAGMEAICLPLFEVRPVDWRVPDADAHDLLLLTSANAVRHAGPGLAALRSLPVAAVGEATANAARAAGFAVALTGDRDAAALCDALVAAGFSRALHLAGRDRTLACGGPIARIETVYASEPVMVGADAAARLAGSVALVHSARAGARLAEIVDAHGLPRNAIAVAAISAGAAEVAGDGWRAVAVSPAPADVPLIETARTLAD